MDVYEKAKKKDDGRYAYIGMLHICASYFNIDKCSPLTSYIVNEFLKSKCHSFFHWIRLKKVHEIVDNWSDD